MPTEPRPEPSVERSAESAESADQPGEQPTRVRPDDLRAFMAAALRAEGVPDADAELLADTLVVAELWGHASHGALRLPWYVERLRSGAMHAVTDVATVVDSGAVVVLDGRDGIGQVITNHAVDLGVERAKAHGVSAIGVRNSGHFGTAAYFTRRAAEAGCVAFLATNASAAMAAWGGRTKSIGTNPWSIAAPAGRHGVIVMDLANTAVARGKLYLAKERGTSIPDGWAADAEGHPTTDPAAGIEGLILPMAGPKGYVIAFLMDVLSGVLTGSSFGADVGGPYDPGRRSGAGHLLLTVDVAAMGDPRKFSARMETLVDRTRGGEPAGWASEILTPGELEDRNRARHEREGILLAAHTWASLATLAEQTGVALPPAQGADTDSTY